MEKKPDTAPAPYAAGTGSAAVLPDAEALARMSYRERLAFNGTTPRRMSVCGGRDEGSTFKNAIIFHFSFLQNKTERSQLWQIRLPSSAT